jgi:hypothetical protein
MTMDLFSLGAAAPRTTRGVPYPQETVTPNSQQVRAETAAADAVIPTDGLDVAMATVTSGAGVPIVFCREVSGVGGCWVSPSCVQYGLNVDASDNVEIGYTVVVGQGEYPAIPEADVYYGSTLFNTLTDYSLSQAYQALPFNVTTQTIIDPAATIEPPAENGSGGTFENVTLLRQRHGIAKSISSCAMVWKLIDTLMAPQGRATTSRTWCATCWNHPARCRTG